MQLDDKTETSLGGEEERIPQEECEFTHTVAESVG